MIKNPELLKYGQILVDRDGKEYKFISYEPQMKSPYKMIVFSSESLFASVRTAQGRFNEGGTDSILDLSIPTTKKKVVLPAWVISSKLSSKGYIVSHLEYVAEAARKNGHEVIETTIEFETQGE